LLIVPHLANFLLLCRIFSIAHDLELPNMMMKKSLLLLALLPVFANAQVQTLKDAAQQAMLTNPEVQAKWHAFQAANGERDITAGAYLPHVDFQAGVSREMHNEPLLLENYNSRSHGLTLTQMLYDGFATSNDLARLDHNRLERLYELYDASESTTLEVVHAHLDVLRYRKLVALAEDNYVQHRAVYDQIQVKAKAGVGRRVDLEQSAGRLALAEANLLTETSNLHDVSARYQRLVGDRPAKDLEEPAGLDKGLPPDVLSALRMSNKNHPAVLAAIEAIRAADSESSARRSAYQPRVDLRLSAQRGTNINSEIGDTNDKTAQIVLTWNLFNGFSDRARLHQLAAQLNIGRDLRDKACRDIRQNLEIAFNDKRKITELLTYLDQHQLSTEKARDAYHQQFDIGQRTLLDLLDTENELFEAKRAYTEALYDQMFSFARVQAGVGNLFKSLGLTRQDAGPLPDFGERSDETEATHCAVEAPETYVADKSELNDRARQLLHDSSSAEAGRAEAAKLETSKVEPVKSATISKDFPGTVGIAMASSTPGKVAHEAVASGVPEKGVRDALAAWSYAWASRDADAYLNAYAPTYQPSKEVSHEAWLAKRRARLNGESKITLDIGDVKVDVRDATHASTSFHQTYRGATYSDDVDKTLLWTNVGGRWVIVAEKSAAH
jgi:adhesin transport system outer membrane protein